MAPSSTMMGIHFKNVGQGDSIIIDWVFNNILHIGIIDCALDDAGNNPVLEHLISLDKGYRIQFIILSHPHLDHDGGIIALLTYLKQHEITTNYFCHDFYFDARYKNKVTKKRLIFLQQFRQLEKQLDAAGLFGERTILGTGYTIPMAGNKLWLRCISPAGHELDLYQQKINELSRQVFKQNSAYANLLSTTVKIETSRTYCLLTADTAIASFDRFYSNYKKDKKPKVLETGQLPHHGSAKNYHEAFWHALKRKPKTTAFISVGKNDYLHPSSTVMQSLQNADYQVHCTNIVNDAVAFYKLLNPAAETLLTALDDDSTVIHKKRHLFFEMPF